MKALEDFEIPHGRIMIIGENEEESGSASLDYYIEALKPRLVNIDVVVCLDCGILTNDRLWLTTSMRGLVNVNLTVKILKVGVHSGSVSGIIPSNFRILQILLARIEDRETGRILIPELHDRLDPQLYIDRASTLEVIGDDFFQVIPFVEGVRAVTRTPHSC